MTSHGENSLKVLVIHPHLNIKGGSERLVKIFLDFAPSSVDVCLLTGEVDAEWFGGQRELYGLGSDVEASVETAMKNCKPDVVYLAISESYYAYLAKRVDGSIPVVMYVHFPLEEELTPENMGEYERSYRFPGLTARYLDYVDVLLANSKRTAVATEMLWGRLPVVVYPCTDRSFFEKPPTGRKEEVVLYVGRFTPLKRQDFLLLAMRYIRERVGDARLVLAGYPDPRHSTYYGRLLDVTGDLDWVDVIPSPTEQELVELYDGAKVYAHPRIGEHFGLAPIEAMSRGAIPVVRGPTGLGEVVRNGEEAFIVDSDVDFVDRITWLLEASDEELSPMRAAARRRAEYFRPERYVLGLLEELRRAAIKRRAC